MGLQALEGQSLVEYFEPAWKNEGGVFIPSEELKRDYLKRRNYKDIGASTPPPDIMRKGVVLSGKLKGETVVFNKHNADQIRKDDGKTFYRIRDEFIEAIVK